MCIRDSSRSSALSGVQCSGGGAAPTADCALRNDGEVVEAVKRGKEHAQHGWRRRVRCLGRGALPLGAVAWGLLSKSLTSPTSLLLAPYINRLKQGS